MAVAGIRPPPMRNAPPLPAEIEEYRDHRWRREGARQIRTVGTGVYRPAQPRESRAYCRGSA